MLNRCLCTLVLLTMAVRAAGQSTDQDKLPRGPQPMQALASIDGQGKLIVKSALVYWTPSTRPDPKNKGAFITQYEMKTNVAARSHALDQVRAYDVRGNPISGRRLSQLLSEEIPVLVSADGKMVDALHLRLYRNDVIVLIAPLPVPVVAEKPPDVTYVPVPVPDPPADNPPAIGAKSDASLKVEILGPGAASTTADAGYQIRITNTGASGAATNVRILVQLPEHLVHVQSGAKGGMVRTRVADLAPGASRDESITLRAEKPGTVTLTALVVAEPDIIATTSVRTSFTDGPPPGDKK